MDRVRFARGVRAGDRAPDGALQDASTGQPARLFDAFRGPHATLLLFDGQARTDDGYASLAAIADRVDRLLGADVRPWVVVWGRRPPAEPAGRHVLLDPEGETHRRYGATAEALYLVRPDGYVGLRAQPASEEVLVRYLRRVLAGVGADLPPWPPPRRGARGRAADHLEGVADRAWVRHHDVLSCYVRPLFLLPLAWSAHQRSPAGIAGTLVALAPSTAWFPAPAQVAPGVAESSASSASGRAGTGPGAGCC